MQRRVAVGALGIDVATLFDDQLEDGGTAAMRCLLQEGRAFGIPKLDAHTLGEENPHALCIPSLAELVQVDEDKVEVFNERLLQGVQLLVIQSPHVELRCPTKLRPRGGQGAADFCQGLILLEHDTQLRHGHHPLSL